MINMITNIDYNGQFNSEVISKLNDKLDKLEKQKTNSGKYRSKLHEYEIYNDRSVVLDIELLGLIISDSLQNVGEIFKINLVIKLIKRILETELYNIKDSEFNKDYMVELLHKLNNKLVEINNILNGDVFL